MDEVPFPAGEAKPGQAIFKLNSVGVVNGNGGDGGSGGGKEEKKKPVMACLFCRERKIACGPPPPGSKDRTCNQCTRRGLECEYPKESRRGLHKRGPRAIKVEAFAAETRTIAAAAPSPSTSTSSSYTPPPQVQVKSEKKSKGKAVDRGTGLLKKVMGG
ncbi:hypothetical protein C8Q75DRAFT_726413 [Abortiporus biennis]|nr:hypothetical protein C8Q75DRAFT_726413 [Abortiporus biennis]